MYMAIEKTILKKSPELKTERLLMHAYRRDDSEDMLALLYDEEIKKSYMIPDFSDGEEAAAMLDKIFALSHSDEHFEYGIYLDSKLIGFVNDVEICGRTIEIGYVIHPAVQNRGYATEMLSAVIRELFRMGYSVVRACFFEDNAASRRVMEKCGMMLTGRTDEIEYRGKIRHCLYCEIRKEKQD